MSALTFADEADTRMAASFLDAILASPEDAGVRMVYADWLDEHGRAERAEFIRVQCALAEGPPGLTCREITRCSNGRIDASLAPGVAPPRRGERLDIRCLASLGTEGPGWVVASGVFDAADSIGGIRLREATKIAPWRPDLYARERDLLTSGHFWDWFASDVGGWLRAWSGSPAVQINGDRCEVGYFAPIDRPHWTFWVRRGFVEAVALPAASWQLHGEAIQRTQPLREVRLTDDPLDSVVLGNRGKAPLTFFGAFVGFPAGGAHRMVIQPGSSLVCMQPHQPEDSPLDEVNGEPAASLPQWFRAALGLAPGGTTVVHPGSNRFGIDNPQATRYRQIQGPVNPAGPQVMMPCACGQNSFAAWHEPDEPVQPPEIQHVPMSRHRYRRREGAAIHNLVCFVGQCPRCRLVYWTDLLPLPPH